MARCCLIVIYGCAIFLLAGCDQSRPEQPGLGDIKIGDIAPVKTDRTARRMLKDIHFDCYSFELPAANIEKLKEIQPMLSTEPISYNNRQAFNANSFALGFGRIGIWDAIAESLRLAGAEKIVTTTLLFSSEQQNDIAVADIDRPGEFFYIDIDRSLKGFKAEPGQFVLRLKVKKIASKRGLCNLYGKVVFIPRDKPLFPVPPESPLHEFIFKVSGFGMRTSPGDFLLLGPAEYITDEKSLTNVFFNTKDKKPRLRFYMLFCAEIYD